MMDIVGEAVVDEVQKNFNTGILLTESKFRNICTIPKVHHPKTLTEYRPITYCNVFYKIISKILLTCLKSSLDSIVPHLRPLLFLERYITDNVLTAYELMKSLKSGK